MAEFVIDQDTDDIVWHRIGDIIEEHYVPFLNLSPYFIIFSSLVLLAGYFNIFFLFYLSFHTVLYSLLASKHNEKMKRPRAGAIDLAEEELERARRANEVPKDIYYIANYGTIVNQFLGKNEEQSRKLNLADPTNIVYDFLVTKDKYMEHTLIGGSTGSGKTVGITSAYIEPLIKIGGGFIYLECKGDIPITQGVLSIAAEYGREDDIYVLDFSGGGSKYNHSLAPLKNGNAVILSEALTNMIKIMEGENSWVTDKALEFMGVLLFLLVIMRDLNIFIDAKDLNNIKPEIWEEDFAKSETIDFNFEALRSYNSFQSAISLYYLFRELFEQKSFVKVLSNHYNHKNISNFKKAYLEPLGMFLTNHGIDLSDRLNMPNYFEATTPEQRKENNYAITPWSIAFHIFGNEAIYGSLVNKRYPDLDFLDVIRNNKIVVVSLPSLTNSRDKNEKIGKFITSLIKSALGEMLNKIGVEGDVSEQEIGRRFRPYKLPFMILADEISNIGNEMMGAMAAMVRSIGVNGGGIGMLFAGQSEGDIKRIGLGEYDGEQIKANIAIKCFYNVGDKYYKETASEMCGEEMVGILDDRLDVKINSTSDISQNIRKEKRLRYSKDFFDLVLKKKTGEGIILQSGFERPEKIISRYVEAKPSVDFRIMRNISHDELVNTFIPSVIKSERVADAA